MFGASKREKERTVKNLDRLKAIHKRLKVLDDEVFEKKLKLLEADKIDVVEAEKITDEGNLISRQLTFVRCDIKTALQELADREDRREGERRDKPKKIEFEDDDE